MILSLYSGAGNTFFIADSRFQKFKITRPFAGADGLIVLEESERADFRVAFYNCDGSRASMCGNGLRCFAKFLTFIGNPPRPYRIETDRGILRILYKGDDVISTMPKPKILGLNMDLGENLQVDYIDTGVPHAVHFVEDIESFPTRSIGLFIRSHIRFVPEGTNVSFAEQLSANSLALRTYERGVEEVTAACGTGAVAAAISLVHRLGKRSGLIDVHMRSNDRVQIDIAGSDVRMRGPAIRLGEIFVPEMEAIPKQIQNSVFGKEKVPSIGRS